MGARQAVEVVQRREIAAGADPEALADAYAAEHLPVAGRRGAGYVDEIVEPRETRERIAALLEAERWHPRPSPPGVRSSAQRRPRTRSSTPPARRSPRRAYEALTIDAIARRAFVSRTTVYFYFPNKRAVVDRLIQRAFADMYRGGLALPRRRRATRGSSCAPRSRARHGRGQPQRPRAPARRAALGRGASTCPTEWAPYIKRFVARRRGAHRARPAARHRARRHRRRALRPGAAARWSSAT